MSPRVEDYEETAGDAPAGTRIRAPRDPRHWCGVDAQNILAGAEATFIISPNMDMVPSKIVIPDVFAPSVAVVGANIGPISIAAGDGPMPGDAFRASSEVTFLPAVPITQNQPLRIRLRNTTTGTLTGVYLGVIGSVKRAV